MKASRRGSGLSDLFFADDLLFFTEEVKGQLSIIKKGLEQFCTSSGQKVNYEKSSILFSSNIPDEEAARPSSVFGVTVTRNLGKYLGHHVLQQGRNARAQGIGGAHSQSTGWVEDQMLVKGEQNNTCTISTLQHSHFLCRLRSCRLGSIMSWTKLCEAVCGELLLRGGESTLSNGNSLSSPRRFGGST